ncbi:MAG: hypothetical protein LUF32_07225 [Clostridiales bacterium]|nr:hypothetical protein [Clostridiales bacterium]
MPNRWDKKTFHISLKLYLMVIPVLFFAGVLLANLRWTDESFWLGYQVENALRQLSGTEPSGSGFPAFLLKYRLPVWTALCICSCFHRGEPVLLAFSGWMGLSFGLLSASLAGQFSLFGILLFCTLLFPQFTAYFAAYLFLVRNRRKRSAARTIKYLILSGFFLAGVLGEYFLNPWFIRKVYAVIVRFQSISGG